MARTAQKQIDLQKDWEEKINRAKKVRENWKKLFHVDLAREYFDGKQNPGRPESEWVTINKIYSHMKSKLPALYAADPYFYVKLKRSYSPNPMDIALWEKRGKIRQSMLNYLKDEEKLKPKARLSIQDAHFAYGICKIYHQADIKENPDAGYEIKGEDGDILMDDNGIPLLEPDSIPINSRYNIRRVHPDDFLWDEDAGPLDDDWNWLAHRIREPWDKAEKNPIYDKSSLKKLLFKSDGNESGTEEKTREERKKGGDVKGRPDADRKKKKSVKKPDLLVAWDIYDLKAKKRIIIAEGGEVPLSDEADLPKGVENHPFAILRFTLRDDSPYPIPPVSPMIPIQKELNMARSDIVKHRKRFNRKYKATGPWEPEALSKIESGDDGTIALCQIGCDIDPIQDAQMDQMRYSEIAHLNNDLVEVGGGTSDEARGIASADSATQAGILDKRLELKEGDAMSMVMDFVKDIARKLDMLVQANISKDEAVRVSGPQGDFWELVKSNDYDEIEGEYEYSVNVGSTIPLLPQTERASLMAALAMFQNFPQLMLSPRLMKKIFEMHHVEDEAMQDELMAIAKQMMGGQLPMPGNAGSQPGVGESRPVSAMGGMQGGFQSLNQPGAGNLNG